MACPEGPHGKPRQNANREIGPGAHALMWICGWSAFWFLAKGQIGQFKLEEQGFHKHHRGLI